MRALAITTLLAAGCSRYSAHNAVAAGAAVGAALLLGGLQAAIEHGGRASDSPTGVQASSDPISNLRAHASRALAPEEQRPPVAVGRPSSLSLRGLAPAVGCAGTRWYRVVCADPRGRCVYETSDGQAFEAEALPEAVAHFCVGD